MLPVTVTDCAVVPLRKITVFALPLMLTVPAA
jgi:hypothetical protein